MKKYDLSDITFLIPFKLDSYNRLENIYYVTEFLSKNFATKIGVLECAPYCSGILKKIFRKDINYDYLEDNDLNFYRANYINKLVRECETPFISIWDTDVITPMNQIVKSIELLRKGEAQFVYPYEGRLLDTSTILRTLYFQNRNIEILIGNQKKMKEIHASDSVGCGFLANKESYIEAGIENENIYDHNLEEKERYSRLLNKGYIVKRVEGPMFHLTHY